ncbi:MAG: putative Short-chain dehydrogenase/reductase [Bryobacterales bacterium]|nr:putative Short-chain dehydrogenase/reductase [Bryobacterales bacterium]
MVVAMRDSARQISISRPLHVLPGQVQGEGKYGPTIFTAMPSSPAAGVRQGRRLRHFSSWPRVSAPMRDFTQSKKFPQHDGNGGNQCSDTVAEFGRLDAAFNNAGVMARIAPTADSTRDEWERVIGPTCAVCGVRGSTNSGRCSLREAARSSINASVAALGGNPGIGSYIGGSSDRRRRCPARIPCNLLVSGSLVPFTLLEARAGLPPSV